MRYLVLFFLAYVAYKAVKRFFANFRIVDKDSEQIGGHQSDTNPSLHVSEDDIEDAEFKDLD